MLFQDYDDSLLLQQCYVWHQSLASERNSQPDDP